MGYLAEEILPQKHGERYKLKKLVTRYFLHKGILFKKGYDGDLLCCLGLEEASEMLKEVNAGKYEQHQGRKKVYWCILQMGYYWPTMRRDVVKFVKKCHSCQVLANLIHTHLQSLQSMVTPCPFHTWGLDLVGPVNPPSNRYIWILMTITYFTKCAKAIPLRKATRRAMANFIKENITIQFGIPHRIISDNGTPFMNKEVRKMLEFYQVKHH